jgi:hypothetical protein
MKMLMGPCAGSRWASRSIVRVREWSGELTAVRIDDLSIY